ncbi:MAG: PAS domain-containing protein [Bacteroidetes bacterium]|nr:PAS domain-containing protein [Bacteroidota bacterium]
MNEQERLEELFEYQILDTDPETELDELAEVASAVCNSPMSIISFIDGERQWYKAKVGLENSEVKRENTFCQYTLDKPNELLIVENTLNHTKFSDHDAVLNAPFIRFYVGVPLLSPKGNVMGTLCVMDTKPMELTNSQKKVLQILAKRTMDFLNARKLILKQKETIEFNVNKLKKLTDLSPGVIYQFSVSKEGKMNFDFISNGIRKFHPSLDILQLKTKPELLFDFIHPEDVKMVKKSIQYSFDQLSEWRVEYRLLDPNGETKWLIGRATPEKKKNGTVVWYGTLQDLTQRKEYEVTMEQIAFDISHVLRRPVATLMSLSAIIVNEEELDEAKIKEYSKYINIVAEELDNYTKKLNDVYHLKNQILQENVNK